MSFNPESAPPEPEISSAETQPDENRTTGERMEVPPPEDEMWRQRGEDLAPAIYDSEVRPEAAGDRDERIDPAFETVEPTAGGRRPRSFGWCPTVHQG